MNAHAGAGVVAVGRLRRLTLLRAGRAYARWVGRAVGWWTVAYLVFWLVVFVVSGVQLAVVPAAEPLPPSVAAAASAGLSVWLAAALPRRRVPPVHLDRRDLIRLALAPVPPHAVLAYRRGLARAGAALGGAAVGAAWSLLAASYLHVAAPWAAPGVAALAVARLDARWLLYAGPMPVLGRRLTAGRVGAVLALVAAASAAAPALALLAAGAPPWAPAVTRSLVDASPWSAAAPLVLVACAGLAARRSLAERWPPRFAPQSFVLAQLGGMRSLQVLSRLSGLDLGGGAEGVERQRLLAALHDRPGSLRPVRSLRRPPPTAPTWVALAWRAASSLYRRPVVTWLGLAARATAAGAAGLLAARAVAATGPVAATGAATGAPGGPGASLGGPVTALFAGFLVAQTVAALLGPPAPSRLVPVPPSARTWGRLAPALVALGAGATVAGAVVGAVPGIGPLAAGAVAGYCALAVAAALVLEKYSSWSGAAPTRMEPQAVAAIVVALPALLLEAFGYPEWTLTAQWLVLAVAALVDV